MSNTATLPEKTCNDPKLQYQNALREVKSNLDVRRILFILGNVLVPTLAVSISDALTGSDYPPEIKWLPENIFLLCGMVLFFSSVLIAFVLARCHFGLVLNANKIKKIKFGKYSYAPLNWCGISFNFNLFTALSSGTGAFMVFSAFLPYYLAFIVSGAVIIFVVYNLFYTHKKSYQHSKKMDHLWHPNLMTTDVRKSHSAMSIEATAMDIASIVVMSIAFFSSLFNVMTKTGAMTKSVELETLAQQLAVNGLLILPCYTLIFFITGFNHDHSLTVCPHLPLEDFGDALW